MEVNHILQSKIYHEMPLLACGTGANESHPTQTQAL